MRLNELRAEALDVTEVGCSGPPMARRTEANRGHLRPLRAARALPRSGASRVGQSNAEIPGTDDDWFAPWPAQTRGSPDRSGPPNIFIVTQPPFYAGFSGFCHAKHRRRRKPISSGRDRDRKKSETQVAPAVHPR
jgi:hypothetical protein